MLFQTIFAMQFCPILAFALVLIEKKKNTLFQNVLLCHKSKIIE